MIERREFLKYSTAMIGLGAGLVMNTSAQREMSARQFVLHQARRRRELWDLLGDLPLKHKPKPPKLIKTEKHDGYTLEHIELDLNGKRMPSLGAKGAVIQRLVLPQEEPAGGS